MKIKQGSIIRRVKWRLNKEDETGRRKRQRTCEMQKETERNKEGETWR